MKIFIFLNGIYQNSNFYIDDLRKKYKQSDKIVCVDGGYNFAKSIGIKPDIIVGDLDSLKGKIPKNIEIRKFSPEKDFSDFELALKYSIELQPERIIVYGAFGGRKDHELINLVVLAYSNIQMVFVEENFEVYNFRGSLTIYDSIGKTCSLISLQRGTIVRKLEGFKYKMSNDELKPSGRGLSNIIIENTAKIEV